MIVYAAPEFSGELVRASLLMAKKFNLGIIFFDWDGVSIPSKEELVFTTETELPLKCGAVTQFIEYKFALKLCTKRRR